MVSRRNSVTQKTSKVSDHKNKETQRWEGALVGFLGWCLTCWTFYVGKPQRGICIFCICFFEHWRRCREWNPYPDDVFFFKEFTIGIQFSADRRFVSWIVKQHRTWTFWTQTWRYGGLLSFANHVFGIIFPHFAGHFWVICTKTSWQSLVKRKIRAVSCSLSCQRSQESMNNTGKYLGLWPCFFDVVTGCPWPRNRGIHADGPGKTGLRQRFGNPLCMWEMSDFFWSEKISLDDSFDQSKKTTWNQEKLCFKPSWAVDGWQLRTGPQFFFKVDFCCLHRLDVWNLHRLDVWNPTQVGCSGC